MAGEGPRQLSIGSCWKFKTYTLLNVVFIPFIAAWSVFVLALQFNSLYLKRPVRTGAIYEQIVNFFPRDIIQKEDILLKS